MKMLYSHANPEIMKNRGGEEFIVFMNYILIHIGMHKSNIITYK